MKPSGPEKGSATVEFALLMIPLAVLAFGVTEFGRAIYQYNAIAKSTRDGVRHISQFAPGDTIRITEAKCLAAFGNTTCTAPALLPGLTINNVTVRDRNTDPLLYNLQSTGRGTVNVVSVEVSGYGFTSMVPWVVPDFVFNTVKATMLQVL